MTLDFSNKRLRGRPFEAGENLKNANFFKAKLHKVDLSGLDLTGANFDKADIREANFSNTVCENASFVCVKAQNSKFVGSNIQGANFAGSLIKGADFSRARAPRCSFHNATLGLTFSNLWVQLILYFILAGISAGLTGTLNSFVSSYFDYYGTGEITIFRGIIACFCCLVIILSIFIQGINAKIFEVIAWLSLFIYGGQIFLSFAWSFISLLWRVNTGSFYGEGESSIGFGYSVQYATSDIITLVIGLSGILILATLATGIISSIGRIAGGVVISLIYLINISRMYSEISWENSSASLLIGSIEVLIQVVIAILVFYVSWRAINNDERFDLVRIFGAAIASFGGTDFQSANLFEADFSRAIVKNSNFSDANLSHANWTDSKWLELSRLGISSLQNPRIRKLVVTRVGYRLDLEGLNFQDLNLKAVNLSEANLRRANLTNANLAKANLTDATLTEVQALKTNFFEASLTGACLEGWNIDYTTNLREVKVKYVYMRSNQAERQPASGEFEPREFTKLFQEVIETVNFIFQNGIDWRAFTQAYSNVQSNNSDIELSIQSIEDKGDGVVVVKIMTSPGTDKSKIHREFRDFYSYSLKKVENLYRNILKAKDDEIEVYRKQNASMSFSIEELSKRTFNSMVEVNLGDRLVNNQNNSINVGRDLNVTNSLLNLGEISGQVDNSIKELQNSSSLNSAELACLLEQLKDAIELEADLSPEDKTEALEQVDKLAKVSKNPKGQPFRKIAGSSIKIIRGTVAALPDTARLVEACNKLLPMIMKLIGL